MFTMHLTMYSQCIAAMLIMIVVSGSIELSLGMNLPRTIGLINPASIWPESSSLKNEANEAWKVNTRVSRSAAEPKDGFLESSIPVSAIPYGTSGSQVDLVEIVALTETPPLLLGVTEATVNSVFTNNSSTSSSLGQDVTSSEAPKNESSTTPKDPPYPTRNCSQIIIPDSPHRILKCPNPQTFNDALRERASLELEIEYVGGELQLPSVSGGALVVGLIITNASLTSITSQLPQTQILKSMKWLDLSGNPEFDAASLVRLGDLPALTHLNLRATALASLESALPDILKNLPNLQYLDLAFSGLHYLRGSDIFFRNKELTYLDVAGNALNGVTLSSDVVRRLQHLNVSGCNLRNIEVQKDPAVGTTHLTKFGGFQNLKVLDVSRNHLKDLPAGLIDALVKQCVVLDITENAWKDSCDKCSLHHLWDYVSFMANDTENCSWLQGAEDVHCFRREEALFNCGWDICPQGCQCDKRNKTVDCRNIGLEKIPWVVPSSTETLLLQNNSLENLGGIESPAWCNLRSLSVGNNQINALLPLGTKSHCRCHSEEDYYGDGSKCFPQNLKQLYLNNNRVHNLTVLDCPLLYPLNTLVLSKNKVIAPGAQECGSLEFLEVLDLSYNDIKNVIEPDFASYPHLKELRLSHNGLSRLQPDVTSLMHNLKFLDLSYNDLKDISGNLSAPKTGLFTKRSGHLEKLFLNNNKLSKVAYVLNLREIPSLTVKLHDNPWDCNCENLKPLQEEHDLDDDLEKRFADMLCYFPKDKRGTKLLHYILSNLWEGCSKTPETAGDKVFMTLMACVIIFCICVLICYSESWRRLYGRCQRKVWPTHSTRVRKTYDCFVVSSSDDYELVRKHVIIPLTQRGYSIAWHENCFLPGNWIIESVERAVRNSSRMLVFASGNFVNSRWGKQEIRRGRNEEFFDDEFRVMALVTETLPQELNRDLFEIVALRTHVRLSDRDYIEKVCNFLPPPVPLDGRPDGMYMTENDVQDLLRRFLEIRQQRERQQTPLSELFHTHHEQNHVTINVDIATASTTRSNSRRNEAAQKPPTLSPEERSALIERFKVKQTCFPTSAEPPSTESTSLQYSLVDSRDTDEDIADILKDENFIRASYERISCRF